MIKVFSILLLPFVIAIAAATASFLFSSLAKFRITFPLLAGAAVYAAVHFVFSGNRYFYVIAHELSHALAAVLSGVKIKKISVKKNAGYVAMPETNAFITLAPYFIPFYAVAFALLYSGACLFYDLSRWRGFFIGGTGFFLSFHILNTCEILSGPVQSDIKKAGGTLFSLSVLLLMNCVLLVLIVKFLFPGLISLRNYAGLAAHNLQRTAEIIASAAVYLYNTAKIYLCPGS